MELHSPVVLDQTGMSIGLRFGASGTPMAILVDAEGRIAFGTRGRGASRARTGECRTGGGHTYPLTKNDSPQAACGESCQFGV